MNRELLNVPTQAKTGLEWATPPTTIPDLGLAEFRDPSARKKRGPQDDKAD